MYVDYDRFSNLYSEVDRKTFERLSFEACRKVDAYTTGADGIKKLKRAFSTDEDDAEAVRRCIYKLICLMAEIEQAEHDAASARGFRETENGLQGKVVTSLSAGSESVSFSAGSTLKSQVDEAVTDLIAREKLYGNIIREHLSGVTDANGVNLLYRGVYPYKIE